MLFVLHLFLFLSAVGASPSLLRPDSRRPFISKSNSGGFRGHAKREYPRAVGGVAAAKPAACPTTSGVTVKAPKKNIFLGLTDPEAAAVTSFLHNQTALNLTAASNATSWDNVIMGLELLQPNKSDAVPYLDSNAAAPKRYAKATLQFGATTEPYIEEFIVGPLPVAKGKTSYSRLDYIFNRPGGGRQRVYMADPLALEAYYQMIGSQVADITTALGLGTATGQPNDTMIVGGTDPLTHENGRITQWAQFISLQTGIFVSETLLPTGLEFKLDVTGRDPSKWSVLGWYYQGAFYETADGLRKAIKQYGFRKPGPNADGPWTSTDWNNETVPHDNISPPVPVQPEGQRWGVDVEEKYVEWMDFSFYFTSLRDTGVQLHNIKYKGERIIYELGLQEALAHYASADPFQSEVAYLDSYYGIGSSTYELIGGYDCPAYATYLNTSFYVSETSHTHPNSVCLFEFDAGYPIQHHLTATYVTSTKNIQFILRSIATVGNYDYMFEYAFHMDGAIHVTVRASGYIQAAFWANDEYGFHIHDQLSGSMHDHVLNYKLDMDINGTANTMMRTSIVPTTEVYPWNFGKPRNTMKLQRSFIENENEAKINWDSNGASMYSVVNKASSNGYGEYRGFKLAPATGNMVYLTVQNSSSVGQAANWATNHLYVVKQKDTEPRSAYPYNSLEPDGPLVDFNKFFNGESLDQQDIVVYFNLGMHHIPDTSDLPNTVFTTAHSSLVLTPFNYLPSDPSQSTIHQIRLNYVNGSVVETDTFGSKQPTCSLDMGVTAYNNSGYVGEVYTPKFPYNPGADYEANPGG